MFSKSFLNGTIGSARLQYLDVDKEEEKGRQEKEITKSENSEDLNVIGRGVEKTDKFFKNEMAQFYKMNSGDWIHFNLSKSQFRNSPIKWGKHHLKSGVV
jgi:hypothetical protein